MKAILIVLLLVGLAWGGEIDHLIMLSSEITCQEMHDEFGRRVWCKGDCCQPEKGHCPHCGAKYVLEPVEIYWPNRTIHYGIKAGMMYFCPNGHVFWEKIGEP